MTNRIRSRVLYAALALTAIGSAASAKDIVPPKKPTAKPPILRPAVDPVSSRSVHSAVRIPLPRKRPASGEAASSAFAQAGVGLRGSMKKIEALFKPLVRPTSGPFAVASSTSTSADDVAAVKRVIEATRKGKEADAEAAMKSISDPVARKLAEWVYLRSDHTNPSFKRFAAFIAANPAWPHVPMFRRRAENALWDDRIDDATVREFFSRNAPTTAKGRLVLTQALLAQGDRAGAEALLHKAWRDDDFSSAVERIALEKFGSLLTQADFKARMEKRLYAGDAEAGLRAASHLGANEQAVARARASVIANAGNAKALLDAIPAADRQDPGYIFSRAVYLRRKDQPLEAAKLMMAAPMSADALYDLDQWWIERRLLVRKLLDDGDYKTAYRIARDTPSPPKGNYRVDQFFTAGWIALRYLHDPALAASHFAHIPDGTINPHALSRGGYWQGRAVEAMGHKAQAKAFYEQAAEHSATYYGQLARARLGLSDLGLRNLPKMTPEDHLSLNNLEITRAVDILYSLDERDLIAPIFAELGESATDVAGMATLCETAHRHNDGRSMLLLGAGALSRNLPLDVCAYPTVGLPEFKQVAPPVEKPVLYSISRQESHFNQKVVSPAQAMGLMQVTPTAAIDTARKFKVPYDRGRLLSDPVYNMQMGAAELSNLITGYRGSYILTFAGYNAGRGRVRQWIEAFGDPRDPKVDPIDWVERIPISETRNYVQRIMENLQVYRARFGGGNDLLIDADIRRDFERAASAQ